MAERRPNGPAHWVTAPAPLIWRDGTPTSRHFDDIYFSPEDGFAETRHVFLAGTGLPEAWGGHKSFVIGETGFGTGLNFVAAWDLWRRTRPSHGRLHFVSAEAYPLAGDDIRRALDAFPKLRPLAGRLAARLGTPLPGIHRFHFDDDGVHLTLLHGDAAAMFASLDARVDAWFLDGFSPARNAAMWNEAVFEQMARLSAPDARVATFTVAGAVRRGLAAAGFTVERRPGFGRKKEMLVGRYAGPRCESAKTDTPRSALILGAGIAGASLAAALTRRGVHTVVADPAGTPAAGASGNPAGILMPRLTVDPTPAGRLHVAACAYALQSIQPEAWIGEGPHGVLQLATDSPEWLRFQTLIRQGAMPRSLLRLVGRREANNLAGTRVDRPGLLHSLGGAVHPPTMVRALLGETPLVRAAVSIGPDGGPMDRLDGVEGMPDLVFGASGPASAQLPQARALGLKASLGQILALDTGTAPIDRVITFGSYAAPGPGGGLVAGSSYTPVDIAALASSLTPDPAARGAILSALKRFLPDLALTEKNDTWAERLAVRATTPDHLPVLGALPRFDALAALSHDLHRGRTKPIDPSPNGWLAPYAFPNLYVCSGLGSRGLVTAPLLAEVLVSQIFGEPVPLERDLRAAIHPARFHLRAMRKGLIAPPD
ncbi:MAG: bifunctional tRNA (5-methylaminomethyl-2-thiouridine)(34)-methyltransferase MnmD/FAD-dependent 5-carboxymethylaminomethyl-2-thiouridine(34) oxidoreductase MnmC [Alphaproteobacteria bacterium]